MEDTVTISAFICVHLCTSVAETALFSFATDNGGLMRMNSIFT